MQLLLDALFSSVALGHMIVDMMNGQRSVLLTYWSAELGLTNTTYAAITTLYVCVASLSQPVFGWLSDRYGRSRLLAAGGILWMAGFRHPMPDPRQSWLRGLPSYRDHACHPARTIETIAP
jgi:MFS family permease